MNIIFVTRRFHPQIGGVEKHVLKVSKELIRQKHKVTVISGKFPYLSKIESYQDIKVRRISYPEKKMLGLLLIWWWVITHLNIFTKADVIHAHDVFIWLLPLRFILPHKPIYVTFHGWEGIYPIPWKNKAIKKLSALFARGNICVGSYIEKWYGIKANEVIYGASDIDSNAKLQMTNAKLKRGKRIKILYFGRLDGDTGLKVYLQALHLLKEKYKDRIEVEFLGDGLLRADAEDLGKVHGFQENIAPYLKDARFVLTSGYLSMLEAMQAKKLVFPTYTNSLKADYIWLSPFVDLTVHFNLPETLARKIEFFVDNPEQEKIIVEQAYIWAKEQTWKKITQEYLNLWKKK